MVYVIRVLLRTLMFFVFFPTIYGVIDGANGDVIMV